MRGSIIERGSSYRIKVPLGKDTNTGKYTAYYETFRGSKTQAQKRLRELLTELDKGTFIKPTKTTLAEYLNSWLEDNVKPNLSSRTHELYQYICIRHIFPTLANIAMVDLKPTHLQHLYALKRASGLSSATVQIIHRVLHKALKYGVKTGLLARNVAEAVDSPKVQRPDTKTMDATDMHLFLEMARDTPYYSLFYTSLFTGMRRAELLALRWLNVDLLLGQLSVNRSMQYLPNAPIESHITFKEPKTAKSRRMIDLTPSTIIVLGEYRQAQDKLKESLRLAPTSDNDLVFCHYDGTPLLPNSVTHAWIKLVRHCGMNGVRFHDARHSHASLMLKQGVHPKIVSERLGHGGIAITLDLYSHVAPGLQRAAANRFDDTVLLQKQTIEIN